MALTDKDRTTMRELDDKIAPLLAGHSRTIQGLVLGQLMATWLNDHYADTDDRGRQAELWKTVLGWQIEYIYRLAKLDRRQMRTHHESRRLPPPGGA
jgi:hypothetical protein